MAAACCSILRSSRCGEYYKNSLANYLVVASTLLLAHGRDRVPEPSRNVACIGRVGRGVARSCWWAPHPQQECSTIHTTVGCFLRHASCYLHVCAVVSFCLYVLLIGVIFMLSSCCQSAVLSVCVCLLLMFQFVSAVASTLMSSRPFYCFPRLSLHMLSIRLSSGVLHCCSSDCRLVLYILIHLL